MQDELATTGRKRSHVSKASNPVTKNPKKTGLQMASQMTHFKVVRAQAEKLL